MMQPHQTYFWLLAAALCLTGDAFATDYFVRKTGSNGNAGTTAGTAWLTVDYGADQLVAGDTLYVGAGTYTENVRPAATCTGTVVNPVRFIADTDGSQTGDAGDVIITNASGIVLYLDSNGHDYLEFYNFKITGGSSHAIFCTGSTEVLFDNCEIYNAGSIGIRFDTDAVTIRNCSFHNNPSYGISLQSGATGTIEDCNLYSNSVQGLLVLSSSSATVNRCRIYDNVSHGINVSTGTATITNCLITGNLIDGIAVSSSASNVVDVQNCTMADNGRHGISFGLGTNTVTNCIVANNTSWSFYSASSVTRLNNLIYGNGSGNTAANATEIVADPQFVSSTDYRVRMLSPAVNAGADMTGTVDDDLTGAARPYDGAWDIGCYEAAPDGHWKLDETAGATAVDSSGRGYDGTYNNTPTLGGSGVFGNAAEFDGVNEHVEVASVSSFDNPKAITVACWAKSDTATWNNWGMLVSKRSQFIMSPTNGTAVLSWYVFDDVGAAHVMAFGLDSLSGFDLRDWHHYACTYDPLAGIMAMYVDGVLINSSSQSFTLNNDTGSLFIGLDDGLARYFDGMMDDARVYSYALNAAEIAVLGTPGSTETLVGHWKLDETSGTTAADSSVYGNDGTYTNGPSLGASGAYPGEVLTAAEFDGVDDHVDIPNMNIDFSQGFSVALWVKPVDSPDAGQFYAFLDLSNGSNVDEIWLGMVGGSVGFQLYMTDTDDGSTLKTIEDNTTFEAGKWVHCVATVDAAGNAILYRNGEVTKSGFYTSIPTNVLRTQNSLATSPLNDNFPGTLDDVRLYNRPLNAMEVAELYGLTGHWRMDEGSGSTAADSTAFANDATLYGATWTTDCAGNSGLEFDGVADTASTNADFDPPERGAIAMWFRSDGPPSARQRPWGVGSDFEMWQDPDGFVSCDVSTDGFQGGFITTEPLHMDGRWYHFIAEYDSDDDSYAIYINGELHKSGISTWAMTKQTANTLTFGTRTGISEYFDGGISDFRIYNRSLTASEKSELSGLAGYWKLDESSGTVAVDSSANGNDGTYTGGVLLNQTGTIDQAADFDGSDDYVTVPDDSTLQMDNAFSISGWIRPDTSSNIDQMVLNKEGEYEIALSPSDELKWGITNTDPGWSWHGTGHIVAIGKWTYIALTYDNGTVNTYANGLLVDTYNGSGSIGDQYTLLNELRIGGRSNNPSGKYFDGLIDDIRLFKRALCPIEIYGQYKTGRPSGIRILQWVEVR